MHSRDTMGLRKWLLAGAALALISVASVYWFVPNDARSAATPPSSKPVPPNLVASPMATSVVPEMLASNHCIYYQDFETGHVWRVSLDGQIRELVVASPRAGMVHLKRATHSSPDKARLHLSTIPPPGGHTVIDDAPEPPRGVPSPDPNIPYRARIVNSDAETTWTLTLSVGQHEIQPRHLHPYWDTITFTNGVTVRTLDLESEQELPVPFYGMATSDHAVIFDKPNVIVWNLLTDERVCIANAETALLWPRDLHKSERFVPMARVVKSNALFEWKLKSPDDIVAKPEYLVKSLR